MAVSNGIVFMVLFCIFFFLHHVLLQVDGHDYKYSFVEFKKIFSHCFKELSRLKLPVLILINKFDIFRTKNRKVICSPFVLIQKLYRLHFVWMNLEKKKQRKQSLHFCWSGSSEQVRCLVSRETLCLLFPRWSWNPFLSLMFGQISNWRLFIVLCMKELDTKKDLSGCLGGVLHSKKKEGVMHWWSVNRGSRYWVLVEDRLPHNPQNRS